jgi:hypothetical protein
MQGRPATCTMKKTALRGPKSAKTSTSASSKLFSIGIDIGKDAFHIVGFDNDGKIALCNKFRRFVLDAELQKLPRCIVGMEA